MIIGQKIIRIRSDLPFLSLTDYSAVLTAWLLFTFMYSLPAELYGYSFLTFYGFVLAFLVTKKSSFKTEERGMS
jgi:hypothetical protein